MMDDGPGFARVDDGAELAGAAAYPFAVRRSAVTPIVVVLARTKAIRIFNLTL
jgi:hypothetical protein